MLRHGCRFMAFMFTFKLCLKNQFDFGARFLVRFCRVTKMNKRAPWMALDIKHGRYYRQCDKYTFKYKKLLRISSQVNFALKINTTIITSFHNKPLEYPLADHYAYTLSQTSCRVFPLHQWSPHFLLTQLH